MIAGFIESTLCFLAFCFIGVAIPGECTVDDSGIYLRVDGPFGLSFGDFGIGNAIYEDHERGHMIQHDILHGAYWPMVAIPSLVSAMASTPAEHFGRWYERWATELGSQ